MITTEQKKASQMINNMRKLTNDRNLSNILGINRNTIYSRLKSNLWKLPEIAIIEKIYNSNKLK